MSLTERLVTTTGEADRAVSEILSTLDPEEGSIARRRDSTRDQRRRELAALLTARPPHPLPPAAVRLLDELLEWENGQRPVTAASDLPRLHPTGAGARISLWQGDITTLAADAVVDAANSQMLGCFRPGHVCIDNAIHAVAGPGLRAECAAHMDAQGHLEPTGGATLTTGHHLPARYVLHTVGPIVADQRPSSADAQQLASCYQACLDAAHDHGDIHSVAFCSISTGVFGYPVQEAATVAVRAVTAWLEAHPLDDMHVVFNTFSDRDTATYRTALDLAP